MISNEFNIPLIMGGVRVGSLLMKYHTHINNLQSKIRYMVKSLKLWYLDTDGNIGVSLPMCDVCEVLIYTRYSVTTFHMDVDVTVTKLEKEF